jgi:hypothetical protein
LSNATVTFWPSTVTFASVWPVSAIAFSTWACVTVLLAAVWNVNVPLPSSLRTNRMSATSWLEVSASVCWIVRIGSLMISACTRTLSPPEPDRVDTLASVKPRGSRRSRTSCVLAFLPPAIVTCHAVPPSNSMLRLRPRNTSAERLIRIRVPERTSQRRECLMNWKFVRSW